MSVRDPTYVREQIEANPIWALAFRLSEVDNDQAPIGWSRYIALARWLIETADVLQPGARTARSAPMTDTDRFTRGAPAGAACAHSFGCQETPVWTHHFPNGSCTYLCEAGKLESEAHYRDLPK